MPTAKIIPLIQQTATTPVWPIAGDVPNLEDIIDDQATTMAAQAVLIDAYQGNLNAAQAPVPGTVATGVANATSGSTTNIVVNSATPTIVNGATVTDATVPPVTPAGTTVLGQISGTVGGNGDYLLSQPVNYTTTMNLTFTPPPTPSAWPTPTDAPTLELIREQQTSVLRMQSSLIQAYQDLLNYSQTPAPPSGP